MNTHDAIVAGMLLATVTALFILLVRIKSKTPSQPTNNRHNQKPQTPANPTNDVEKHPPKPS